MVKVCVSLIVSLFKDGTDTVLTNWPRSTFPNVTLTIIENTRIINP